MRADAASFELDLVVVVPGKDEKAVLDALLRERRQALRLRTVRYTILVHFRHDAGCFREAPQLLQPYRELAQYALVLLDHHGSGRERDAPAAVETDLDDRLERAGWRGRSAVIVIDPELERWIWSDSPHVADALGWKGKPEGLRDWLRDQRLWSEGELKPKDPRRTLKAVLQELQMPMSPALFGAVARSVSVERCKDETFVRLRRVLSGWFSANQST